MPTAWRRRVGLAMGVAVCVVSASAGAQEPSLERSDPQGSVAALGIQRSPTYGRLRAHIDAIRAIDTHDHLEFHTVAGLYTLWRESYFGVHVPPFGSRDLHVPVKTWWPETQTAFQNGRTTCFYRYQLPAFKDLYGVDFNALTLEGAEKLDAAVQARYKDPNWIRHVVTERANIDMLVIDYDYTPYDYVPQYDYGVAVVRLNPLVQGFHREEFQDAAESPYSYAERHNLPLATIDDYCGVLDHLVARAASRGAVGMKSTLAYKRTLRYDEISRDEAAAAFGRRRQELSPAQIKAFEDYVFWQFCRLSAQYEMPLQIHTGVAFDRSNPMHLENVIAAHPETTFILFHGGFPWVGETGMMLMRYPKNVWIDSNWLPLVSYTVAKRAYHEWLDLVPSNRIMWGTDTLHAEGLYGATVFTRQCLAEVLSERVDRGDVSEEDARRIAEQILRENALEAFPRLRRAISARR